MIQETRKFQVHSWKALMQELDGKIDCQLPSNISGLMDTGLEH
jgi:hypothetical protein